MKTIGIISEYNPFHNGHKYQIEKAKEITKAENVVAVMSGSFVQRGDAAIFDKWTRAKMALNGGVDLVIELPVLFSLQSAEYFARGGVQLLHALGVIDYISFGVENDDISLLWEVAKFLQDEPQEYKKHLEDYLSKGYSFPRARASAMLQMGYKDILDTSNNILGVEYLKQLIRLKSTIMPVPIIREGAQHDSVGSSSSIASASHIRSLILNNEPFGQFVPNIYDDIQPIWLKSIETAIIARLRLMSVIELSNIRDVTEGLENRIKQMSLKYTTLDEIIDHTKTKRYTHSRIRRVMINAFLGITKDTQTSSPEYIRVLGFNEKGREILKKIKNNASLPIITKTANAKESDMLKFDFLATDIYSLMYNDKSKRLGNYDKKTSPIII